MWAAATCGPLKAGATRRNDADGDGSADPWTLIQTKAEFEALADGRDHPDGCAAPPRSTRTLSSPAAATARPRRMRCP